MKRRKPSRKRESKQTPRGRRRKASDSRGVLHKRALAAAIDRELGPLSPNSLAIKTELAHELEQLSEAERKDFLNKPRPKSKDDWAALASKLLT